MLKSEISRVDLGISGIELESTKDGLDPVFIHEGIPGGVGYILESEGTKRFYRMFPYLYYVLKTGSLAVLDELDNDIHPLLISEILQYFYSPNTNPHNAQLVMSSHSPSLLEFLEKEEVYFTEKSDSGETEIYGLKDIQGVRRSENIYGKYLSGAYGGIPRVG